MPSPQHDPAVAVEIGALHDAYERALALRDSAALTAFFWDSPRTVRYGTAEHLYGSDAIAAYRERGDTPPATHRRITRRTVATFGPDTASVFCEIEQIVAGRTRQSRQSQLWIRFPEVGWKITAAHVSHASPAARADDWAAYAEQAAATLGLPLAPEHRTGVALNLQRTAAIVAPLLAFSLPDHLEPAPVFTADGP